VKKIIFPKNHIKRNVIMLAMHPGPFMYKG
jgi:hypothetical protein